MPHQWLNSESLVSLSNPDWYCVLSSIEEDVELDESDEELNPDDDPEGGPSFSDCSIFFNAAPR